jgi:hypothetical protein
MRRMRGDLHDRLLLRQHLQHAVGHGVRGRRRLVYVVRRDPRRLLSERFLRLRHRIAVRGWSALRLRRMHVRRDLVRGRLLQRRQLHDGGRDLVWRKRRRVHLLQYAARRRLLRRRVLLR